MRRWIAGLVAAWGLGAFAAGEPTVIVLSWDGVRHDYPDRGDFPGLARLERDGVRARLVGVYPSNTFPSHVSLATGTYPDTHGIVDNIFFDDRERYDVADADWIQAEPVWISTQRQGIDVATYFWVGSESDWRGHGTRYRVAPFDGRRREAVKVDRILTWFDLPAGERPQLVMSYWAGADTVGHERGPGHPAVVRQLASQDAQLRRLLAGLDERDAWPATTLILVSDHGMAAVGGLIHVERILDAAGVDAFVIGGAVARVYLDERADLDKAEAALAGVDNLRVYRPEALPAEFRLAWPGRNGDLVVTTVQPFVLTERYARLAGTHGYDPRTPDMQAAFFAMGRGVDTGADVEEVRHIDLAATIAALLGVEPPAQSEGAPMGWVRLLE
ncbi:MAG: alkaline phosphatase family protein [Gammaproteobacteria bacterium]|nr:alkaline phosphatase family protein [Gammaproteobacteria bacterium]